VKARIEGLSWDVAGREILRDVEADAAPGEFVGLIGPNGSGKSSLLRCVYRVLEPEAGLVTLDGEDVWRLGAREAARRMGVVQQETNAEFDFTVQEIVLMGRSPHKGMFERDGEEDLRIVEDALGRVGMLPFAGQGFPTLSGGEKQRVLIARALAQRARFLVLDEPTNHLDIRHGLEALELVKGLGVTTLAALHDLNLAALYCDRLYVLRSGEVVASGATEEVLRADLIREVYGVGSEVRIHPVTGRPHITFFPGNYGTSTG
jgi:iron complex transport system ATP-binding protein